jgi:hypothetical protein
VNSVQFAEFFHQGCYPFRKVIFQLRELLHPREKTRLSIALQRGNLCGEQISGAA